jgi:hypothetical protein
MSDRLGNWIPLELVLRARHFHVWGPVTFNGMITRFSSRVSCLCGATFELYGDPFGVRASYVIQPQLLLNQPEIVAHEQAIACLNAPASADPNRIRAELAIALSNTHRCHATLSALETLVRELNRDDAERCLVAFEHVLIGCDGVQPLSSIEYCAGHLARACNDVLER